MQKIKFKSGYFKSFDETSHYYESRGEGPPMVFIYGIGCLINHWKYQLDFFSSQYRVITYDLRGHHKSVLEKPFKHLDIQSLAKDLGCLFAHLNIEKAILVGHSFGAQIAIEFTSQNQSLLKSLVLINGFSKNPLFGGLARENLDLALDWFNKKYEQHPTEFLILWKKLINNPLAMILAGVTGGFNLAKTPFKDIEIYAKGVSQLDIGLFVTLFRAMINFNGEKNLKKINIPTLVIAGSLDKVTPKDVQIEMSKNLKKGHYVEIQNGSHCSQLDFPDQVNQLITDFI